MNRVSGPPNCLISPFSSGNPKKKYSIPPSYATNTSFSIGNSWTSSFPSVDPLSLFLNVYPWSTSLEYPRLLKNSFYRTFHYLAYFLFAYVYADVCICTCHRRNVQSRGQFDRFSFYNVSPDIKLRLPVMVTSYY